MKKPAKKITGFDNMVLESEIWVYFERTIREHLIVFGFDKPYIRQGESKAEPDKSFLNQIVFGSSSFARFH